MTTYRVQSSTMRNSMITTNYGVFRFNSEGIVSGVPYGLAQELLQLEGFVLLDDEGNEIELPETDPDAGETPSSVTLSGGEVWTTIPGGYTIQDSNSVYTLIGSAFDYNPPDVSLQSGSLTFGSGIDTANVHAMGVESNTTVHVGTNTFVWRDTDNNLENGYELVLSSPPTYTSAHTLPGGGYWYQTDNGYVLGDDSMTYTIVGDFYDSDTITIDHGALVFSAGVDTASIHVIGVESDATLMIGDVLYKWADTDNNPENGYELTPYVAPPEPTLPAGWATIDGGYTINDTYTLLGSMSADDVTIEGTTFSFGDGVDTSSIHLAGVQENDTVYVGSDTYVWKDTDGNAENGYELTPYVEPDPQPEVHELPNGAAWYTDGSNVIISDTTATYTLVGAQVIDSDTVALDSGVLSFGANVDTDAIHVLGVNSGATVAVGDVTYQWVEADNNDEDGLELIHYVAPEPEPRRLPSGTPYDTIEGGYVISDTSVTYTLTGGAFDNGLEGVVDLQSGTFVFDSSVTTSEVHIQGIAEDTTLKVGDDTYIFQNTDDNPDDMEIKPYEPPVVIRTLPSGAPYDTIEGGYVVSDTSTVYTLTGTAFASGLDDVDLQNGTFVFGTSIDTLDVHVAGVTAGDTLYVGDAPFIWSDTDENVENGLEIAEIPEQEITLPSGWSSIEGGFAYDDGITVVTVRGVELDANNHLPVDIGDGGIIIFDEGIDITAIHAVGVYNGDILRVGDTEYQWFNADNNPYNGLEIYDLPEPQPTLPAGWSTVEGGLVYTTDTTTITISGVGVNEDNSLPVTIVEDALAFDATVPTASIHVQGVTADDTLYVGTELYTFKELDNNTENGLEITPYIAPPTVYTLPNGGSYSTVEGGFAVFDDSASYTLVGGSIDENNIAVQSGALVFGAGIDTTTVHFLGVDSGTTIAVGDNIFKWADTDNNPANGLELEPYVEPEPQPTLPAGWATVDGGLTYNNQYTIMGATANADRSIPLIIDGETFIFDDSVSADAIHVQGVTADDTLKVGDSIYRWADLDNNLENGFEIADTIPPSLWTTIADGFVYESDTVLFTLRGSVFGTDSTPEKVQVVDQQLVFDDDIDTSDIHVQGIQPGTTITIGTNTYTWKDLDGDISNGYELELVVSEPEPTLPAGWSTVDGGLVYTADTMAVTLVGVEATDPFPVSVDDQKLIFSEGVDTDAVHAFGVNMNDSAQVGDTVYTWTDRDNNPANGLELTVITIPDDTVPASPWTTVEGGYRYDSDTVTFTFTGSAFDDGHEAIVIDGSNLSFQAGLDTDNVHVIGVSADDTVKVGTDTYIFKELDNNTMNGYELEKLAEVVDTLPAGWGTITGGLTYTSDTTAVTISGVTMNNGTIPVEYADGKFIFSEGTDTDAVHAIGVSPSDTVQVASAVYIWTDRDNNPDNGLEITAIPAETTPGGDDTVPGDDTIPSDPTVPADTVNGFSYDFDGVTFTLKGGIKEGITLDDLNENARVEKDGLEFGSGIISTLGGVHITGLQSGTTVKVAGENYTLMDADGNLENGYELVGGEADAYDWKRTNRSSSIYEPQIWRHYTNSDDADILVIGCSARPLYEDNTLTLLGDDIKVVSNESAPTFKVAGDIYGKLTTGVGFDIVAGIVNGEGTSSYIIYNHTLYLPGATITGVGNELEFTLSSNTLTVQKGSIDVENVAFTGSGVTTILYNGKRYYINAASGKLVRNAWQRY